jgi:hypothetical protein
MIVTAVDGGLDAGLKLDRLWHVTQGTMEQTKEPTLLAVCAVLGDAGVAYALIEGVPLQIHSTDPRTTLDIDLAVVACADIPRERLVEADALSVEERALLDRLPG